VQKHGTVRCWRQVKTAIGQRCETDTSQQRKFHGVSPAHTAQSIPQKHGEQQTAANTESQSDNIRWSQGRGETESRNQRKARKKQYRADRADNTEKTRTARHEAQRSRSDEVRQRGILRM
jgi:hypothetical protein